MKGKERRDALLDKLTSSNGPIAGKELAKTFGVSRQVIVQDIALLRASQYDITSTTNGYILQSLPQVSRVFKVFHADNQVEEEMNLIVDYGGEIKDVFVYHKTYGVVRAEMNIQTRKDVQQFLSDIQSGKSSLLMNVTSGYHYHTIAAPSKNILDLIQEQLQKKGFLAQLQDYEPIDFWKEEK